MEAALYEVDVNSLEVRAILKDRNGASRKVTLDTSATPATRLPGWHGKGLYSGQGRIVFSNNGDHGKAQIKNPDLESGALGEWKGSGDFELVSRNQFTEVTGPGGIYGNQNPETDPVWATGWDKRSVILKCLDHGQWLTYRLPKASHTYDGGHGWYTEWPRIRDIGQPDLLMNMHGTLWHFPKDFSAIHSAGIAPRSTHLAVFGDFCAWNGRVVLGCDVTDVNVVREGGATTRKILAPGRSQSNLWFVEPTTLDHLGSSIGEGAVWLDDEVKAKVPSDPILFARYAQRELSVRHSEKGLVTVTLEVDVKRNGEWKKLRDLPVPAGEVSRVTFDSSESGAWLRLSADSNCAQATALMHYRNADLRTADAAPIFTGVAAPNSVSVVGGLLHAGGGAEGTLSVVSNDALYELNGELKLTRRDDAAAAAKLREGLAVAKDSLTFDDASAIYVDEENRRWRLPKGDAAFDASGPLGDERVNRSVITERNRFNCAGTFYELPAVSAGGFTKIRPITTHNRRIKDYATFRGLLVLSGVETSARGGRIVCSEDGKMAVWVGAIDDLWQFGKPRGQGGPWKKTGVIAGKPSDPYLMWGFDERELRLSHDESKAVAFQVEIDLLGDGHWVKYQTVTVPPGAEGSTVRFAPSLQAHWLRLTAADACTATAWLKYN